MSNATNLPSSIQPTHLALGRNDVVCGLNRSALPGLVAVTPSGAAAAERFCAYCLTALAPAMEASLPHHVNAVLEAIQDIDLDGDVGIYGIVSAIHQGAENWMLVEGKRLDITDLALTDAIWTEQILPDALRHLDVPDEAMTDAIAKGASWTGI